MADSESKILYTEIDEEVSSILDRLKLEKEQNIEIVIPRRALILQSLISLKLLQKQAKKLAKDITIVTVDKKGRDLSSSIGLQNKAVTQSINKTHAPEITINKVVSSPHNTTSTHTHGTKSINDIVSANHYEGKVTIQNPQAAGFKPSHYNPSLETGTLNRKLLIFFTSLSLIMLAVVFMVILPSTTINIKPKSDTISFDANLKIVDAKESADLISKNPNRYLPSYKVYAESELTETFPATGIAQNGSNSTGKIIIYNDGPSDQVLIKRTRFRSSDGIIFRLQDVANVPRHGSIEGSIIADPLDEKGEVTGAHGNLVSGNLTIPGLKEANQKIIYATVKEPFTGGISEATRIASQDDITGAQQKLSEKIKAELKKSLQDEAVSLGKELGKDLQLLNIDSAIKQVSSSISLANNLQPNQPAENFTITVSVALEAIAFDQAEFRKILDRGLLGRVTPDTRVVKINYDDTKFQIIDESVKDSQYTIQAGIEAVIQYDIEGYYKDIIISNIAGKSLAQAIDYLQSQNYLTGKARIRMWPFWLSRIPSLADNIKIKAVE